MKILIEMIKIIEENGAKKVMRTVPYPLKIRG